MQLEVLMYWGAALIVPILLARIVDTIWKDFFGPASGS